jgi:hypothetical protein
LRAFATVLDLVVVLLVAVAVVVTLGVSPWVNIGGRSLVLPHAWEFLLFAAVTGLLRYGVHRNGPLLPSLQGAGGASAFLQALDAERERFANPAPAPRELKYYALAAALVSLVWVAPHLQTIRDVPTVSDPIFSAWRLERFTHQLLNEPTRLLDGNIFHPSRHTLTYSDPTILEGLIALPFIAAGGDPLVVSNILFLTTFPLSALAFFVAAWRLTTDPRAACIAGILGGLAAFKIEHYAHLELQFFFFAPLALIALMRMFAAPSARSGAVFGALFVAQWLASMYFGMMLLVFLTPITLLIAVAWRIPSMRALSSAIATAGVIVLAAGSITAVPFMRSKQDRGDRSVREVGKGSAVPSDYGAINEGFVTYSGVLPRSENERELFPGTVPIALGLVGALPPVSLGTVVLVAATAVAFDGSLGVNGLFYDELYEFVLPFRGMRMPVRFAAFVSSGLILLSAYGARRVLRLGRTPRRQAAIFALLAAGTVVDLRSSIKLMPYFDTVPPIYANVTSEMVLAELPTNLAASVAQMYFSTFHGARLINGYSGYYPAGYDEFKLAMDNFPTVPLLAELRRRGATHVTVNCRLFRFPSLCTAMLETMDTMPVFERISDARWEGAEVRLYKLGADE